MPLPGPSGGEPGHASTSSAQVQRLDRRRAASAPSGAGPDVARGSRPASVGGGSHQLESSFGLTPPVLRVPVLAAPPFLSDVHRGVFAQSSSLDFAGSGASQLLSSMRFGGLANSGPAAMTSDCGSSAGSHVDSFAASGCASVLTPTIGSNGSCRLPLGPHRGGCWLGPCAANRLSSAMDGRVSGIHGAVGAGSSAGRPTMHSGASFHSVAGGSVVSNPVSCWVPCPQSGVVGRPGGSCRVKSAGDAGLPGVSSFLPFQFTIPPQVPS